VRLWLGKRLTDLDHNVATIAAIFAILSQHCVGCRCAAREETDD
jgi:hypothetical protein